MPPFKNGLLKRKADSKENVSDKANLDDEFSFDETPEFTLEQNGLVDGASEESSDLTDSEDDGDSEGDDSDAESDNSDEESDNSEEESDNNDEESDDSKDESVSSVDSAVESGPTSTPPEASDSEQEEQSRKQKIKTVKVKEKKKQTQSSIDKLADTIKKSSMTQIMPVGQKDEYESGDTSDEEDRRNTVGDVPMWWYNEYQHVGYDLDGRRIIKPPQRDQIDEFLKKCEDPEFWRTVRDPSTGQDVVLSKQDLELIHRLRQGHVPDPAHDEYQPWIEWFSSSVLQTPLRAFPEHKRSFLPSRCEQARVSRLVHALKMGWTKTRKQLADERRKKKEKKFYNLWGSTTEETAAGIHRHIPAPRRPPPSHAESYNPPPEYLLDARELREWRKLQQTPWKRPHSVLPAQHSSLRAVPAYERFTRERFLRCLDLYLAPRAIKMRLTISATDLVPKLPSPRDLQPFPTHEALQFRGHEGRVRAVDVDPSGQYAVSTGDDCTLRVWETSTGRCLRTIQLQEAGTCVAWTPVAGLTLVCVAAGSRLLLVNPGGHVGAHRVAARTDELLRTAPPQHDVKVDERTAHAAQWQAVSEEEWARGVRVCVTHFRRVTSLSWHARGDYVCVTLAEGAARSVLVHQVSRRRSQLPLGRSRGLVQCAVFHPARPQLLVATQRVVRVYDLLKQEQLRKLLTGAQWVSTMALHPAGDNLLVASYDRKCIWFDLELSSKPYQTLRLHGGAVRAVAFHKRYPLFASAGDDHNVIVSHATVYNDLLQNPLLVPLKQLQGGAPADGLCVLDLKFHPTQPWLLAACADGTCRLYT